MKMNHLANETSPYLLQHADNPVHWYPWGDEAIQIAKEENKPILLSIGYSACHWCHVMEHESFENEQTARIMNDNFVCIKVDREERPDIDQIYMNFVQMTTGSGGWPLNVFLTPDLEPFFGGTYFPPDDRYGRPSWTKVMQMAADFYQNRKSELDQNLGIVREAFAASNQDTQGTRIPDRSLLIGAARSLSQLYDKKYGGLGSAPKFPAIQPLTFFLRIYRQTGDEEYLTMVSHSLEQMARGGIYDHLGGGFARYSVDEKWLVPHFEKMLYDNAQLVPLYLDVYLLTKKSFFLQIAKETLNFIDKEMRSGDGGFYSSLDADSEGEEGKYYVWTRSEIDKILGKHSDIFCDYYDVTEQGNFEGKNILYMQSGINEIAKRFNLTPDQVQIILNKSREQLLTERHKRIRPGLDDKILTSWNALMLSAYARAYQITGKTRYAEIIRSNVSFLKSKLSKNNGLYRTFNKGKARYAGYAEDYAFLIQALLDSYEAVFENDYLKWAQTLMHQVKTKFWDSENIGYYMAERDQKNLIYRMKDEHDHSIPSATGVMLLNLLRFYSTTENDQYINQAEQLLRKYGSAFASNPYTYSSYLNGLDFYLQRPKEIFLVLPTELDTTFTREIFSNYLPNKVVIKNVANSKPSLFSRSILQGKEAVDGKPTAYVCHNFTCSLPVTSSKALLDLLQK
jgi:uncharacterized protein YyaL (SSP411 family)